MLTRVVLVAAVALLAASCAATHHKSAGSAKLEIYDFEHDLVRVSGNAQGRRTLTCSKFCPRAVSRRLTFQVAHGPELTARDVDPASVRAERDPSTRGSVVVATFTSDGQRKFRALTRTLASRGRAQSNAQHFAIVVDGRVLSAPFVDYLTNPTGIDAPGIEITGLGSPAAARLVKALRRSR